MKDIQIIIDGKIASYKVSGNTIDLRVDKPEAKPLLADAKVGDKVELRDGNFTTIRQTKYDAYSGFFPIYCSDNYSRTLFGVENRNVETGKDIIRLIPKGTPEWQELELLAKYPQIERDLTTVQVGDTVLMADGQAIEVLASLDASGCFGIALNGFKAYSSKSGKYVGVMPTLVLPDCLGIIARAVKEYTFMEACDLLDSGEAEAVHIPENDIYMTLNSGCYAYLKKRGLYKDKEASNQSLIKSERLATNWQIYKK